MYRYCHASPTQPIIFLLNAYIYGASVILIKLEINRRAFKRVVYIPPRRDDISHKKDFTMKLQPASKSYFFDKGYRDIASVIKKTWVGAFSPVKNEIGRVKNIYKASVVTGIFTTLCDLIVFSIITIAILAVMTVFTVGFTVFVVVTGVLVYLGYTFLFLADLIYRLCHKISTNCPNCQSKFGLPVYVCQCGARHTNLSPSEYGILKRRCNCSKKLSVTFFNGRQKLTGKWVCPKCNHHLTGGVGHQAIAIPVVGGPSSGKTCYISMAISQIERVAPTYNLKFEYLENQALGDDYNDNKDAMVHGHVPMKTNDMRLRYYQFFLGASGESVRQLVSLCDVAGETYENNEEMSRQIGFKHAGGFLMLIDPLSVTAYRQEVGKIIPLSKYNASERSMDEILDALIHTLESMKCIDSKSALHTEVAVVFTKSDIPGLTGKIGKSAVANYMKHHADVTPLEAQNVLCEEFLAKYGESNFLNTLRSKFKSIQFFTCSALGHVENGSHFQPQGVEDPVLWLIDKLSGNINLKDKWGKKI